MVPSPDPLWVAYHTANALFADRVVEVYKPGDLIIVHDYHLLLAPKMIRDALSHYQPPQNWAQHHHNPSPALHNEAPKGMDWDSNYSTPTAADSKSGSQLDKPGGFFGSVGSALGQHLKSNGNQIHAAEVMIGMFMHTPWPSSEIFRCLPSELPSSP